MKNTEFKKLTESINQIDDNAITEEDFDLDAFNPEQKLATVQDNLIEAIELFESKEMALVIKQMGGGTDVITSRLAIVKALEKADNELERFWRKYFW